MKFTLPWLKDYLEASADLPAILEAMTQAGLEVEDAHDPKDALKQFTVCRIFWIMRVLNLEAGFRG